MVFWEYNAATMQSPCLQAIGDASFEANPNEKFS